MAKSTKKKPPYNREAAIRGALRRAFSRSPLVQEVMAESRREVPRYNKDGSRHKKNWVQRQCQVCGDWVSTSKMAVDHIVPVISVEHGKESWDTFIDRLWCITAGKANLQRICDPCHDKKTQEERIARLLIKYSEELDAIETDVMKGIVPNDWKKLLNKYTAKKKTKGLESVVQRALTLKEKLKNET